MLRPLGQTSRSGNAGVRSARRRSRTVLWVRPDGGLFHLSGEFLEIDPPSRLIFTFRWEEPDPDDRETVVMLSLDSVGDATELSFSQGEFATEARLALHRSGWTDGVEKLRELIESGF